MSDNRLLIVDDEPAIGAFIGRIAANAGYEIMAVSTTDKFLQHVRNWRPTHIMMDLQMPLMDGPTLLSHLAAEKCSAGITLISGVDRSVVEATARVARARGLKVTGVISKPMRAAELLAELNAIRNDDPWLTAASIASALAANEFRLVYQPKIDLRSAAVTGFEALIRWQHPTRGAIPPLDFIPYAESSAVIDQLTQWLSMTACQQLRAWDQEGIGTNVALNISARNLHEVRLPDLLDSHCRAAGLSSSRVTLELTETAAMQDAVQMMDVLSRLRIKGFKLSIDDFGTGYSSLVQLHRLPFNEIKVDRTFVSDCTVSEESRSIVRLVIDLAHALHMRAVAEGVENAATMDLLRELGCDEAQGYFISRPLEAQDVPGFLRKPREGDRIRMA